MEENAGGPHGNRRGELSTERCKPLLVTGALSADIVQHRAKPPPLFEPLADDTATVADKVPVSLGNAAGRNAENRCGAGHEPSDAKDRNRFAVQYANPRFVGCGNRCFKARQEIAMAVCRFKLQRICEADVFDYEGEVAVADFADNEGVPGPAGFGGSSHVSDTFLRLV